MVRKNRRGNKKHHKTSSKESVTSKESEIPVDSKTPQACSNTFETQLKSSEALPNALEIGTISSEISSKAPETSTQINESQPEANSKICNKDSPKKSLTTFVAKKRSSKSFNSSPVYTSAGNYETIITDSQKCTQSLLNKNSMQKAECMNSSPLLITHVSQESDQNCQPCKSRDNVIDNQGQWQTEYGLEMAGSLNESFKQSMQILNDESDSEKILYAVENSIFKEKDTPNSVENQINSDVYKKQIQNDSVEKSQCLEKQVVQIESAHCCAEQDSTIKVANEYQNDLRHTNKACDTDMHIKVNGNELNTIFNSENHSIVNDNATQNGIFVENNVGSFKPYTCTDFQQTNDASNLIQKDSEESNEHQRHPNEFNQYLHDFQRYTYAFQQHPYEFQQQLYTFQQPAHQLQPYLIPYQQNTVFHQTPSVCQNIHNSFTRYPHEFQQCPDEFEQYTDEFKQYPDNFKQHTFEFQPRTVEFQQYTSENQQHEGEFEQHPNEFEQHPNEFEQHPNEFEQQPNEIEQYVNEFEQISSEFKQNPNKFAKHSDGQQTDVCDQTPVYDQQRDMCRQQTIVYDQQANEFESKAAYNLKNDTYRQQNDELQQLNTAPLQQKDASLQQKNVSLQQKDAYLQKDTYIQKDASVQQKDDVSRQQDNASRQQDNASRPQEDVFRLHGDSHDSTTLVRTSANGIGDSPNMYFGPWQDRFQELRASSGAECSNPLHIQTDYEYQSCHLMAVLRARNGNMYFPPSAVLNQASLLEQHPLFPMSATHYPLVPFRYGLLVSPSSIPCDPPIETTRAVDFSTALQAHCSYTTALKNAYDQTYSQIFHQPALLTTGSSSARSNLDVVNSFSNSSETTLTFSNVDSVRISTTVSVSEVESVQNSQAQEEESLDS